MEFLLKVCTRRNLIIAAALLGLIFAADHLQRYPRQWYRAWRYPPQKGASPGGDEIMALKDKTDSARLVRRYDRVMSLLAQAQAENFAVDALERKAAAALQLNNARYRPHAVRILVEVEMDIPRKKVQYIPLHPLEEEVEIPQDLPGRRVGKARR